MREPYTVPRTGPVSAEISRKSGKVYNSATAPRDFSVVHNTHPLSSVSSTCQEKSCWSSLPKRKCGLSFFWREVACPKKIATELHLSHKIVHLHLYRIRKKLSIHSTIEIIVYVCRILKLVPHCIKLTPRGKEVFLLVIAGFKTDQIACQLGISRSGVRRHRENMLQDNGCESMIELIAKYYGTYAKQHQEMPYGN